MSKRIAALVTAVGIAIAGCGSDGASDRVAGNGTDRAFVAAMIPHHESAVQMAAIAGGRAESDFVKELASNITDTQTDEIELMRKQDAELKNAGVTPGKLGVEPHMMGMDQEPASLAKAQPFDAAFIKMMIPHHEGAVAMAREELDKGKDPELRELAQNIVDTQQREIDQMIEHSKGSSTPREGREPADTADTTAERRCAAASRLAAASF
jgi:uncharacterized protein (DUF305 family)